jgi:hypothetical protein
MQAICLLQVLAAVLDIALMQLYSQQRNVQSLRSNDVIHGHAYGRHTS